MATDNSVDVGGQRDPRPRAAFHQHRPGQRQLRAGGQPPLAEPSDPGMGGGHVASSTSCAGARWRRTSARRSPGAPGSWWPVGSSSAAGRPRRVTAAPRSRSSPTRSVRRCAGRRRRSPRTNGAAPATVGRGGCGGRWWRAGSAGPGPTPAAGGGGGLAAVTDSTRSPSDGTEQPTRRSASRRAPKDLGRRSRRSPARCAGTRSPGSTTRTSRCCAST